MGRLKSRCIANKPQSVYKEKKIVHYNNSNLVDTSKQILNPREVASIMGISMNTVYLWLEANTLPGTRRVGRKWFIMRTALEDWLYNEPEEREVKYERVHR